MTAKPTLKELVAIQLRYDAGQTALNVRAISQLLLKELFAKGRLVSADPRELTKAAAKVLGIATIEAALVSDGLEFMRHEGFAKESAGRWMLTDHGFEIVAQDVGRASDRLKGVLRRHFPESIDQDQLGHWFTDACVEFYRLYGAQWAAALARRRSPVALTRATVQGVLTSTIGSHGLKAFTEALVDGFHTFLSSQDPQDVEHNWSLGQALLASMLVAANVGADPVTSGEFRDCILLLDTSLLLATVLEAHEFSGQFDEFGQVLQGMNTRLEFIEDTRAEYTRVVDVNRRFVLHAVDKYRLGVLAGSDDAFVQTALQRGCKTRSDFETFFDSILDPPTTLGETVPLTMRSDADTLALAERGRTDESLKTAIAENWNRQRPKQKKPWAAEHDAALTSVVEGLNAKGVRCAVLTLDMTMHDLSLRRAGAMGIPRWIPLDALIQILAVDSAGPEVDAADFAPLMARIIQRQCEPMLATYTPEDLGLILDIEERCAALSDDDARYVAITVARERLKGRARGDRELALAVTRAFQKGKFNLAEEAGELRQKVQLQDAAMRSRNDQLTEQLGVSGAATDIAVQSRVARFRERTHLRYVAKCALALPGTAAFMWIATRIADRNFPKHGGEYVSLLVGLFALFEALPIWLLAKAIPAWRGDLANAPVKARMEVEAEVERRRQTRT